MSTNRRPLRSFRAAAATTALVTATLAWAGPAASGEIRSFDGSGNNIANPTRGAAGIPLLREPAGSDYGDGLSSPAGASRDSARTISNAVSAQSIGTQNSAYAYDMVWQWGQFLDHDIDLTPAHDPLEPFNISVPAGDPDFGPSPEIVLDRSIHVTDGSGVRQQLNTISAYIDGSNIYGWDETRADALREHAGGRLRTSAGDLLPFESGNLAYQPGDMFASGDVRVNEQSGLSAMHTLFMREHNRRAGEIAAANPGMSDEDIYQRARGIVIAEMQSITYNEFLPALLGAGAIEPYVAYDDTVDASISNVFSTAAYRFGHSMLSSEILRLDNAGNVIPEGNLALRDAFFNPSRIVNEGGIDPILRGLITQYAQEIDPMLVDDVRNFLFGPPGAGGFDLAALNIQRGRDHGLPGYNDVRIAYGLDPIAGFDDPIFLPGFGAALASVYGSVDEIDAWIGGLAELHFGGAMVGELVHAVLVDQFTRLRDGDRFWYETLFEGADLLTLRATTLGDIIARNSGVEMRQESAFVGPLPEPASLALFATGLAGLASLRRRRRR